MSRGSTAGDIEMNRTLFLVLLVAAIVSLVVWLIFVFAVGWLFKFPSGLAFLAFITISLVLIHTVLKKR